MLSSRVGEIDEAQIEMYYDFLLTIDTSYGWFGKEVWSYATH